MNKIRAFFFPLPFPLCMVWHFILGGFAASLFMGPTFQAGVYGGFAAVVAGLIVWATVLKNE